MTSVESSLVLLLGRVPLLSGLPERELASLAAVARLDRFEREGTIFRQGDPAHQLWLLREGRVKIVHHESDGREVILEMVAPGEVFGGAVLFLPQHPATARAMTEVETVSFSADVYSRLLASHPELAQRLIRMLGSRLHSMMDLNILSGERVDRRLAHILLKLAERLGRAESDGVLITIPLARQDLADMAGTTLETAIRTMSRFREQGLVTTLRGGFLLITDLERLRAQAGNS
jgi:CRP-like cAMP-binding protein